MAAAQEVPPKFVGEAQDATADAAERIGGIIVDQNQQVVTL